MIEKFSPMMERYKKLKESYKDAFLFYRLGDFYEMFFEDAVEASKLLDLTLTGRDCGLAERAPMCGVPYHAADQYIAKFIKLGKKVAVCEQLTSPGESEGLLERDVVRVVTPGTVTEETMLEGSSGNYLASAVVSGKRAAIAYSDVSTGELKAVESDVSRLVDFLASLSPSEIIASREACDLISASDLVRLGRLVKPEAFYDYSFDFDNSVKMICRFFGVYDIAALGLEESKLAVRALGGILKYIETTQKRDLKNILPPKILRPDNVMFLDFSTKRNLELIETLADKSRSGSLLGVLDRTKTNMGSRLIKKWITEPAGKLEEIEYRLNAVAELKSGRPLREKLALLLSDVRDVERITSKIACSNVNPRECRSILFSLNRLKPVKELLKEAKSTYLLDISQRIDPLENIAFLLENALAENPPALMKDGGAIKAGYSAELDKYREAAVSGKRMIAEYEAKEKSETGIKNLKIGYNRVFGYYIEISNSSVAAAPYRYERKQTLSTGERYVTKELKELEESILGAEENSKKLEEKLYSEIKKN
jgi:Mismatch repair ATPase (MutS family)